MPADFGPLSAKQSKRVYDQINVLSDLGLSQNDIMGLLGQSRTLGRSALDDYMNAAGMNIAQSFQPQFEQGRNFLGANPLLADSGYANRLNRQLLTDLASRESGAFNDAAAQQAQNQVGYFQGLEGSRIGARQGLANQAYDTILNPKQKQSTGQKIRGAVGQGIGAIGGAILGGPAGAAAGFQAHSALGGGLGGGGQSGYSQSGIQGGYSGYIPGQPFYPNSLYPPMPSGGYSEPAAPTTMMRRGRYPW